MMATVQYPDPEHQMTLYELQNEFALSLQLATPGTIPEGAKTMLLEHFRQCVGKVARQAIRAVEVPQPTLSDRKEAPGWSDVIDSKRIEQSTRAQRFLTGSRW